MAKSNLRLYTLNSLKDTLNKKSNWLDMGVSHVEPKFVNDKSITGARYGMGAYAFNYNEDIPMNFSTTFTIAFWAKAVRGAIDDDVYKNNIVLVLEAGDKLIVEIPDSYDLTEWHFFVITRDSDNNINFCIDTAVLDTKKQSGDFNLGSNSYFFLGNQNRYATGFTFEVDDIIIFDGSVDSSFKPDDYVSTNIFTQLLVIDSSGQVWGYSYDGSSSGGGDSDIMMEFLSSVEDEFIVPDNISILQYSLSDNDSTIVRSVEVAPTDVFKYYSEYDNDNVYTLAVYDLSGNLKHKAYTTSELANSPTVEIKCGAEINKLIADEYNGYINGSTTTLNLSNKIIDSSFEVPDGIYKLICFPDMDTENKFYISVSPGDKVSYIKYLAPNICNFYAWHLEADKTIDVSKVKQYIINTSFTFLRCNGNDSINKCGITTKSNLNDYICSYCFDYDNSVIIPAGVKYYYHTIDTMGSLLFNQTFSEITDTSVQHIFSGRYVTSEHEVDFYLDDVKIGGGQNYSSKLYWFISYIKE